MKFTISVIFAMLFSACVLAGEIALSFDDAPIPGSELMSAGEKTEKKGKPRQVECPHLR